MISRPWSTLIGTLLLAAVYFGTAKLGFLLAFVAEQVTVVWAPTGISLAALLVFGYRFWPGVALGAFLANATSNEPLAVACGIAVGNTLEAVIGAGLLRRIGFHNPLDRLRDVLGLVVLAGGLSTTVSATIGSTCLCLGGAQPWSAWCVLWWVWWLGDAMGDLVMAPVLLIWIVWPRPPWPLRRLAEAAALYLGLGAVCAFVFTNSGPRSASGYPLEYTIFPFAIWAALRFGQRGVSALTLAALVIAILGTVHRVGPFSGGTIHESLVLLHVYTAVLASSALILGAIISERQRAEDALRLADRRKDVFLATLSHELRNPLAPIRTSLHLLTMPGIDGAAAQRAREVLQRQVQYLIRLVDDLLDVSRIMRDRVELRKERIDLAVAVSRAVEMVQPTIEAAGHKLVVQLPTEPILLDADPVRLVQVIANLLNNAAKYTEQNGQVRVRAEREGSEAVVRVRDTGVGIAPEMLSSIFDLFVQADASSGRTQGGLGIGLTLARKLTQLHGGSICASSDGPGKGSEFVVRLPALC